MIIEQLKQELELNTVNSIEVYFHSGDSVIARKIDYSQSSEKIIKVLNPVGSGDSTVAGIASAIVHHESDENLLKKANTLGMLNAQEAQTGYVNMSNYSQLFDQIEIIEV